MIRKLFLVAALVLPGWAAPLAAQPAAPGCFPGVPGVLDCIDPQVLGFWQANGGLEVFGYPISPLLPEETADGLVTMQHFERNRLEVHPANQPPYHIQLGRLGADRLAQSGRESAPPDSQRPGCRYFAQTGHNICGALLAYWQSHGLEFGDPGVSERESLALLGLPLTETASETNSSGDTVPTQWFERARLEDHSAAAGRPLVLGGRLDAEIQSGLQPAAPPAGPIAVMGGRLVQGGRPVVLKGLNYYPATHTWSRMWIEWDGPAIAADIARARRELGVNTLRVLVPYGPVFGWNDLEGNVAPQMLTRLREMVQIAGREQIKVIVTLFDWHDGESLPGSRLEQAELTYMRTIVGAFKDDDRVLAWDLHNEPDNYGSWKAGNPTAGVDWLERMAAAVRAIDRLHPITVGMTRPESLWIAGSSGTTVASISDFISVHSYDAMRLGRLYGEVRARSDKPVVLEEFGWPSGPECRGPYFEQNSQLFLFRQGAAALNQGELAGGLSWWMQDMPFTSEESVDENGFFGLYDHAGRPKPAVGPFRSVRVPALPSLATSDLPLSKVEVAPPPDTIAPIFFGDIPLMGELKLFWAYFGGEALFGPPITRAYREQNDNIVQYFARARLEVLDGKPRLHPTKPKTTEMYLERIRLTPLGQQAAAGRGFAPVADPALTGVRYFPATGHTLRGEFARFWDAWGEPFFGPPLSEEVVEQIGTQPVTVQYFTNWRFERWPDGVRLSPLGVEALRTRQCPRP